MLAVSTLLLLFIVGWDLRLGYWEGAALLVLLFVYLGCLYWTRQMVPGSEEEVERLTSVARTSPWFDVGQLLAGLASILIGSHLLIGAATAVAGALGVSEWVIAVTIVAAGTSLPELAVSLVGVWKGRYGISAGNVIGSDIFNLVGVLGLAGLLSPVVVEPMARVSMAALFGMVLVVLLFMRTGWRLTRLEGLGLVIFAAARWGFDFAAH
jgi:cation:H+ antiporter